MPNPYPVVRDPLNAQQFRTQRTDNPEDLWQPLYDRANIASAAGALPSQVSYFSTQIGQTATLITGTNAPATTTKGYTHTNMQNSSVVPTKMFNFIGISMAIIHGTLNSVSNSADRDQVMNGGFLQFRIVDKDILFVPLNNIPLINPIGAVATTANNVTITSHNFGGGAGVFMYKLPIKVTLNPYENFSVTLNFVTSGTVAPALLNAMDIQIFLQGFQRRPT